jgi:hypothetical protein
LVAFDLLGPAAALALPELLKPGVTADGAFAGEAFICCGNGVRRSEKLGSDEEKEEGGEKAHRGPGMIW